MMTEQEKQLLSVTLCSMLPYGVVVKATYKDGERWKTNDRKLLGVYQHDGQVYLEGVYTSIDNVKPYLRPMSSMTEEEFDEFSDIIIPVDSGKAIVQEEKIHKYIDFCNTHHFDWNGLIEKGIALEAPEGMYNT